MLCTRPDVFNNAAPPDLFRYRITDGKFGTIHIINVPVVTSTLNQMWVSHDWHRET